MNFFGDDYCEVKIAAKPSRCNSWSWYGYRCARECGTCVYIATPEPPPSPASPPSPQSPPGPPPPPVDPPGSPSAPPPSPSPPTPPAPAPPPCEDAKGTEWCEKKISSRPGRCNYNSYKNDRCQLTCGTCTLVVPPTSPPPPFAPPLPPPPPETPAPDCEDQKSSSWCAAKLERKPNSCNNNKFAYNRCCCTCGTC